MANFFIATFESGAPGELFLLTSDVLECHPTYFQSRHVDEVSSHEIDTHYLLSSYTAYSEVVGSEFPQMDAIAPRPKKIFIKAPARKLKFESMVPMF
jgi:hypothetical protein